MPTRACILSFALASRTVTAAGSSVEVAAFPREHHRAHGLVSQDSVAQQAQVAARAAVATAGRGALRATLDEMSEMDEIRASGWTAALCRCAALLGRDSGSDR